MTKSVVRWFACSPRGGAMRIDKKELVRRVSKRIHKGTGTVEEMVDATLEEIYEALKQGECVSLRNLNRYI